MREAPCWVEQGVKKVDQEFLSGKVIAKPIVGKRVDELVNGFDPEALIKLSYPENL